MFIVVSVPFNRHMKWSWSGSRSAVNFVLFDGEQNRGSRADVARRVN